MGALLFTAILARIREALGRLVSIAGLYGAGALICVFAAGYGLDAGHTALTFRYGPVPASLAVAGILLALALCMFAAAVVLQRRGRAAPASGESSPYSNPPRWQPPSRRRVTALAALSAGAMASGLVALLVKRMRKGPAKRPRALRPARGQAQRSSLCRLIDEHGRMAKAMRPIVILTM